MSRFGFPVIDIKATGEKIKEECLRQGYSVKEIKEYLGLGSIQSVYNWFGGRTLPSLENMLALSCLLKKRMEELVAVKDSSQEEGESNGDSMASGEDQPEPAGDMRGSEIGPAA